MSNKDLKNLNPIDKEIKTFFQPFMNDKTEPVIKIELINGFELFNTRPYHNYETWSNGYRVTDIKTGLMFEAEDLDDAIRGFIDKIKKQRGKNA
jgi:hypothetical protein